MAEQLLTFRAGRAFRREGTNFVDPIPTKGAIILASGDDGLLHFMWKNRTNNEIEEVSMLQNAVLLYRYNVRPVGFNFVPDRCYLYQGTPIVW
jgi:hypothetical protein